MRIPELNEGYIKMNMEQMTQEAEAEMEEEGMILRSPQACIWQML